MALIDTLRRARERSAVAFHRFLLDFGQDSHAIYAFFEGENDESYYLNFLRANNTAGWPIHTYNCRGKDGVLALQGKVDGRVGGEHVTLYFVDKDLSDILGEAQPTAKNVYVTDLYSIENYVVSADMVVRILCEVLHHELSALEKRQICASFNAVAGYFYERLRPIMAFMVACRKAGKKVYKDELPLAELFPVAVVADFACAVSARLRPIDTILSKTVEGGTVVTRQEWRGAVRQLDPALGPKRYIRGKYELWLGVAFTQGVAQRLQSMGRQPKAHINVNSKTFVDLAGPRCSCPPSLASFLKRNFVVAPAAA